MKERSQELSDAGLHDLAWTRSPNLRTASMHELADRVAMRRPDAALLYARKNRTGAKWLARELVLDLFRPDVWPDGLKILTFPGIRWDFEHQLLNRRAAKRTEKWRVTLIIALERDEAIYRAAVRQMPGVRRLLIQRPSPPWATTTLKTSGIKRFHRGEFERAVPYWQADGTLFGGAWLDFLGPVTHELGVVLPIFWQSCRPRLMVITTLCARWPPDAPVRSEREVLSWFASWAPVREVLRYNDQVPMLQVTLDRTHEGDPARTHFVICRDCRGTGQRSHEGYLIVCKRCRGTGQEYLPLEDQEPLTPWH